MKSYEILDSQSLLSKFHEELGSVGDGEIEQWKHHPCTRALLYGLAHSEAVLLENWRAGQFTDASTGGTAQKNAQVLGHLESIELMKQYILEDISPYDTDDRT